MTKTRGTKEWAGKNINFSKGCSNNCRYCYARRMAHRFGWKRYHAWHNMINKEELSSKRFKKINDRIMTPSSHDITIHNQELAKTVIYNLLKVGNELLIVSKPRPEVIRNLIRHITQFKAQVQWRFTIGTLNDQLRQYWEPGAPSIQDRMTILKEVFARGWRTSVSIEPFLDQEVVPLIKQINPFVTETIWVGPMNKIHVPNELWTEEMTHLYSPTNLITLKNQIDRLKNHKIRYKDHFLNKIGKVTENKTFKRNKQVKSVSQHKSNLSCTSAMS